MKKIILLFLAVLLIDLTLVFAADNASEVASGVISGFKDKKYSEIYKYFYVPPYYTQQDIENDKARFIQALKNFNGVLGDVEKYTEIPATEYKYECCLGSICGVSESGSYTGNFSIPEGKPVYLKTFKVDFSKIKSMNVYIFAVNWRGKFLAIQLGTSLPPEFSENMESMVTELAINNDTFFCDKFPDHKAKVFADRIVYGAENVPRGVEFDLSTKEGQELLLKVTYPSGVDEGYESENVIIGLPEKEAPFAGERIFHLVTTKNEEVAIQVNYSSDKLLQNIAIKPPKREGNVSEELLVESKAGFLISINVVWKDGEMEACLVSPYIHPFKSLPYTSCSK